MLANVYSSASPGKSSLTVRFIDGHFVESYYPTIENTFSRVIKYNGQDFATEIVDTAGQVCVHLVSGSELRTDDSGRRRTNTASSTRSTSLAFMVTCLSTRWDPAAPST